MAFTSLNERLPNLPLLGAPGPMLGKVAPSSVAVWLELNQEAAVTPGLSMFGSVATGRHASGDLGDFAQALAAIARESSANRQGVHAGAPELLSGSVRSSSLYRKHVVANGF